MRGDDLPLVSVLTPVYNYGRYLARTLDSALAQDYPAERIELVIVDDGSTDATPEVIAEYAAAHPGRIRALRQDNRGFIAATNATFREARGELWAFLDSDDVWPVHKVSEQVQILRRRPEVGAVYSDTELIDPHDRVVESSVWSLYGQTAITGGKDALFRMCGEPSGNPALNSTIMVRAALAERFAPIPSTVPYVDWWVMARIAGVAELATSPSRVGYRTHGENITLGATGLRLVREVLKSVQMRRQLLLRGAADRLTTAQTVKVWQVAEQTTSYAASLAKSVFVPLPEVTEDESARSREHAAHADRATRAGQFEEALRHRALALAADPWDAESREWLIELGEFALEDVTIPDHLEAARSSIVLAFLDELEHEPQLLAAYAEVVGPEDDITLAVAATDVEERTALRRVEQVIAAAGVALDRMPDALLIAAEPPDAALPASAVRVELERRAHALLSRRPPRLGLVAYGPDGLGRLKADLVRTG